MRGKNMKIDVLQKLCRKKAMVWSAHALARLQSRGIFRTDVRNAILTGEIIEAYPEDFPDESCLILGTTVNGQPLHVVCGCNEEFITVITAYYPTEDYFERDFKTRKEKP